MDQTTPAAPETAPAGELSPRDAAIAELKATRDPAPEEPTAAEPEKGAKEEPEEAHEVKVSPEAEIKARARARIAAAEAKERELEERYAAKEAEYQRRQTELQERDQRFSASLESLRRLALDDPSKFLEQTGVDLNSLVKSKLHEGKPEAIAERALRELADFRKKIEEERAEEKRAAAEAKLQADRQATEAEFLTKAESAPYLARLAKRNPSLAIQNAYLISGLMQRENGGKIPAMEDLIQRIEEELRGAYAEEAAAAPPVAAPPNGKGVTPKKAASPANVKSDEDMTPAEQRAEAIRLLREMRKSGAL